MSVESPHKRRRTVASAFVAHKDANADATASSVGANASTDASTAVIQYEGFEVVNSERGADAVPEDVEEMRSQRVEDKNADEDECAAGQNFDM